MRGSVTRKQFLFCCAVLSGLGSGCGGGSGVGTSLTNIGPSGGRIFSSDGKAILTVPAGALNGNARASLAIGTLPQIAGLPGAPQIVNQTIYTFTIAGALLTSPATLQIAYTGSYPAPAAGTSGYNLSMSQFVNNGLQIVPNNVANRTAQTVSAPVTNGGTYVVTAQFVGPNGEIPL